MKQKRLILRTRCYRGFRETAVIILLVVSPPFSLSARVVQQIPRSNREQKQAEIAGVKFVVPVAFGLEQLSDSRVAFLRHTKSELALFVAVTDQQIDDSYL